MISPCPKTQLIVTIECKQKSKCHLLTEKLQDRSQCFKRGKIYTRGYFVQKYKIHISYQQAWRGKDYAIQQIRGSPYEAFEMLPYYCFNLEQKNEGTVTRIKTDKNGVFEMLFIAIGASIHTFRNYLRPVLMIDAAHLKGLYKGTNLVAVAMDGNNQIVPIAFGICKGETGPCWTWWMSVLRECIGDNPNLLFISDRHVAISLAVEKEFPLAFHVVCCRHLMMNLSLKNKKRKDLYWKICKAYTREDFAISMTTLQNVQHDAYQKLCEAGVERWSRAHCPLVRYNYMTSNSVESINAKSVIHRKDLVLKLAETYRVMVQECTQSGKKSMKSVTWVVKGVKNYQYEVSDGQYIRAVNLHTGICECRKWQLSGIPCGHVISVTRFIGLTDCVQYVADWFKKPKYQGTYSESIHILGNMSHWDLPPNIQKAIPPRMDNPQPGRPKNTNRIKSQGYIAVDAQKRVTDVINAIIPLLFNRL
ncbi:transposase, MuDR, MULE transposase domain protein [Tanacetum coccineum]|uniref:Transposase, MuDR, MULE transposase domain protein n=1 Tax=Tanacetum coccineum TaxID=301880 RepID=A0ABQ4YHJ4_9ASTR